MISIDWTISVVDVATIAISVFALAVSSYRLYMDHREKRPRLVVKLSERVMPVHITGFDIRPHVDLVKWFEVAIANPSDRDILVSSVDILWRKAVIPFPENPTAVSEYTKAVSRDFPINFSADQDVVLRLLQREGASGAIEIRTRCQDVEGNVYLSNGLKVYV